MFIAILASERSANLITIQQSSDNWSQELLNDRCPVSTTAGGSPWVSFFPTKGILNFFSSDFVSQVLEGGF